MGEPVWADDLIRCPSQCYAEVAYPDGTPAVLYLRWRWGDPWQATIIKGIKRYDEVDGEWMRIEVPHFTHDELDEAKAALLAAWELEKASADA